MAKFYCNVAVSAVYTQPSFQAEMCTQLLYGETFEILSRSEEFYEIKSDFDGVEGFISVLQASEAKEETRNILNQPFFSFENGKGKLLLSAGSEVNLAFNSKGENIAEVAQEFLNVPFLHGGRSFFGVDAAAFTQLIYKICGKKLPRFAPEQAEVGRVLDFVEEARPGDLAFFENEAGEIIHTGILLHPAQIIHVYGKVRIDALDYSGIYNAELKRHTHRLRFAKNYFS